MNKYKIIAICGKSASGKDTLLQEIKRKYKEVHEIIGCTTRPPRDYEVNGKDYFFLSLEDFAKKDCNGEMLEVAKFRDWYYGTSLDGLKPDSVNIGVFNPTGIYSLMQRDNVDLFVVQVQASNKVRLMRSLRREANPDVDEIVRRYLTDKDDFEKFSQIYEPDYIFDSEGSGTYDLECAAQEIVLLAERHWAEETN